jgi:hypothetical protein
MASESRVHRKDQGDHVDSPRSRGDGLSAASYHSPSVTAMLALQRIAGNQAVGQLVRKGQSGDSHHEEKLSLPVQPMSITVQRQSHLADVEGMSDEDLAREQRAISNRLLQPVSRANAPAEQLRLQQIETEIGRRTAASRERAPIAGLLGRLRRLAGLAATEQGGQSFAAATQSFQQELTRRLGALSPGAPLPPDLRMVVMALMLWSTDPGNQWGEGIFESSDLVLTAAEYATVPASQNKCNAYVAEVIYRTTGLVFAVHAAGHGRAFPYRAAEWHNVRTAIAHFPVVSQPQLGDVGASRTHVGIYLGSYGRFPLYISARDEAHGVLGLSLQHEHGIQIKWMPPEMDTFRRYQS